MLLDLPEFGRTSCDKEPGIMSALDNQLPSGAVGRGQNRFESKRLKILQSPYPVAVSRSLQHPG